MKSVVEMEIDVPRARLAELHANPELSTRWMHDIERYEPIAGEPGTPGSQYRLVPKAGTMIFVATVIARDLPNEVRLQLDASHVRVLVTARFAPLTPTRTQLVSEQVFEFKGPFGAIIGVLARWPIRRAHRRHMEAFKRFAEGAQ